MILSNEKVGLVIQARMGSTRLPEKVLMDLCGKPLLLHIIYIIRSLDENYMVIIATTTLPKDDAIKTFCDMYKILCFRGSEKDVLDRYYKTALTFNLDHIVRLTGDNPLIDGENLQHLIDEHLKNNADYSSNKSEVDSGLPEGVGAEIFTFYALERSWREGKKDYHREHVDEYILENMGEFNVLRVEAKEKVPYKNIRLTVDT
ncbi:MAG: acylneuraminate cytidylyltransferase, partial [Candidatus Aenigmarchaeota archaeon]|nr:acylneuraminate cytidylyltransferase [Candidatus Aenigmarchaeota archaeon]